VTDTSTPDGYYERFGLRGSTLSITAPRSEALAWGHVEPTAEEIAAERDRVGERYAEQVILWAATRKFLAEVEAADLSPLVREVLALHHRTGDRDYAGCEACSGCCGAHAAWPCGTARLLIRDAGIEVPDELVFETPVLPIPDPAHPRWPFPAGPVTLADQFPKVTVPRALLYADNQVVPPAVDLDGPCGDRACDREVCENG
jgi:hypothetical protein